MNMGSPSIVIGAQLKSLGKDEEVRTQTKKEN
jgi:hypothetical protein